MWFVLVATACRPDPGSAVDRLVAELPPSAVVVDRFDGGWPVVAVIEVPDGDPRASTGDGAAEVLHALVRAGATDVFTRSDDLGPGIQSFPAPDDETVDALRRYAALVAEVDTPLAGLRDLVLSGAAPPRAVESYQTMRTEMFARFEAIRGGGLQLVDRVVRPGPVGIGVPGVGVAAVVTRLREAGASVVVVRPADLVGLEDPEAWWAGLEAALPPVVPAVDGLPSFEAWVVALGPHAAARGKDVPAGLPPPELPPDDPRREVLVAAAHRLRGAPGLPVEDPVVSLTSLRWSDTPLAGTPMSYDPLHDTLRVDPAVAALPPELVAAVLAHELVHVHDLRAAAASLGTDPAGWARLHDTLPLGVMRSVSVSAEDRAFRVEIGLLDAIGVWLPDRTEAERIVQDPGASDPDRLRATLAVLHEARPGTYRWMKEVSRMVGTPR